MHMIAMQMHCVTPECYNRAFLSIASPIRQPASPPSQSTASCLPLHCASRLPRASHTHGPAAAFSTEPVAAFFTRAVSSAPRVSPTSVNSTRRRASIPKQQGDVALKAYVANVCFKCFRCLRGSCKCFIWILQK
jgi:hypothetical protein